MVELDYRGMLDAIDYGFCVIEVLFDEEGRPVDYRFLEINATFEAQTGLGDAVGKTMRSLRPDHEAHWFEIYGNIALTGEARRFEKPAMALGRWYDVFAFRVGAPDQRRVAILFNDIIQRKRSEERLVLLAREIDHRARNVLGLVASIARLTHAETVSEYREKLTGRLDSLAASQRLLLEGGGHNVQLVRLVEDELAAYDLAGDQRVTWNGPPVALGPDAARCVGMVIHELATNATKYGALSDLAGRVSVQWQWRSDGRLGLCWSEQGGPAVVPPTRSGLGSGTIEGCICDQLGGEVSREWRPTGLVCHMTMPASIATPNLGDVSDTGPLLTAAT